MYEFTAFYLYKAVFTTELLISEYLMCVKLKRRPYFVLRYLLAITLCLGFSFAIPVVAYNALYCSVVFLLMFGFSLLTMKMCFEESWVTVIFRGLAAYTTQHIAYQIFDLLVLGIGAVFGQGISVGGMYGDGGVTEYLPIIVNAVRVPSSSVGADMFGQLQVLFDYCSYAFVYILVYALGFDFVTKRLKDSDKFQMKNSALFVFVVCFVLFNVVISSVVTYYSGPHFDAFYVIVLALYNIVCSFFTMYIMFEVIYRKQLKREFTTANRLLKQSEEQYKLAKENIELINLKCHDLKHQIRHLGNDTRVDSQTVKEIENMISIYDAGIRTGNEALDIILTEKSLYCNKHGIRLYSILDGKLLSFISDSDLYSLFGNLLDNAIEAVENLEEEKRFINLSVKEVNGFPTVSTGNCFVSRLEFDKGLPKTTKENKDLHGFGMKSIKFICKKYEAELNISVNGGMFEVNIIFINR